MGLLRPSPLLTFPGRKVEAVVAVWRSFAAWPMTDLSMDYNEDGHGQVERGGSIAARPAAHACSGAASFSFARIICASMPSYVLFPVAGPVTATRVLFSGHVVVLRQ